MSEGAYIVRPQMAFERNFTSVPNEWVRDQKLRLATRGLLALLMSHETGFQTSVKRLIQENVEGRATIDKCIAELKQNGYLKHELVRDRGRIVTTLWVLTDPAETEQKRRSQPELGLPARGFTGTRFHRHAVDQHLIEEQVKETTTLKETAGSTRAGTVEERVSGCTGVSTGFHKYQAGYCLFCGAAELVGASS